MHVFSPKPEKCSLGAGTGTLQLIFLNPQIGTYGFHGPLCSQGCRVQHQVVVLHIFPIAACVVPVVIPPLPVNGLMFFLISLGS